MKRGGRGTSKLGQSSGDLRRSLCFEGGSIGGEEEDEVNDSEAVPETIVANTSTQGSGRAQNSGTVRSFGSTRCFCVLNHRSLLSRNFKECTQYLVSWWIPM